VISRLATEVAKFGVVGLIGVLVNLGAFAVLQDFMQTGRANALSTAISIATNYVGYRYWVYRDADRKTRTREISLFLVFSLIGAVIQVGVVYASKYWLGLDTKLELMFAAVAGIGLATVFRFIAYRTWVFRILPAEQAVEAAEQILAKESAKQPATKR
jgi:putative flippase GtrA